MQSGTEIAGVFPSRCGVEPHRVWYCRSLPHFFLWHCEQYSRRKRKTVSAACVEYEEGSRASLVRGQHDRQRVVAQDIMVVESRCGVDAN